MVEYNMTSKDDITLCYVDMMPTFSHPTGKRAHLMNVYTNRLYRRQGVASLGKRIRNLS